MRSAVCLLKKRTDDGDPAVILPFLLSIALKLLGAVVAVLTVVATADYLFQHAQWYPRQKDVAAGDQARIPPDRGRSYHQGQRPRLACDRRNRREIPHEHYRAVAESIGYVMRLRRMAGASRPL